ncbi:MAG: hypothetical protein ACJAQ4_002240 [Cryomorphaceae bacterium]|jgi:hypothetical protein
MIERFNEKKIRVIALVLVAIAISPFAILSFFSFPAVDDYSFFYFVNEHGFWGAQMQWYTTWTGRYFSSFILSLNPLLVGSDLLYQLIIFSVLVLTVHSVYVLLRKTQLFEGRNIPAILSFSLSLAYLSHLPDLTQAFYWLPGSITYQLSLAAGTYIIGMLISDAHNYQGGFSPKRLAVIMVLTVVACASNEIMMLITNFAILLSLLYSIFIKKNGIIRSIFIQIWAIITGLLVVFAPGNKVRGGEDFSSFDPAILYDQITSSIQASEFFFQNYLLIPILPLIIIGLVSVMPGKDSTPSKEVLRISTICSFVLIVVFLTFLTSFVSVGLAPPARSQNIPFWFVVFGSFFLGVVLSRAGLSSQISLTFRYLLASLSLITILLFPFKTGFEASVSDLIYGSASEYKKQQQERHSILSRSEGDAVIPALTAFPNSVYLNDLYEDKSVWWNVLTSMYYGIRSIEVDYKDLEPTLEYTLNYNDPIESSMNIDPSRVKNNDDSDQQSTYSLMADQIYGPGVSIPYTKVWKPITHKLAYINVKCSARLTESAGPVHIIVTLVSENGQSIMWRSAECNFETTPDSDGFHIDEFWLRIDAISHRDIDDISIYLWNPNQTTLQLKPLEIELY